MERGQHQPVDPAVIGVQALRGVTDARLSLERFQQAGTLVQRARSQKAVVWSTPGLAQAVDLALRAQGPTEVQWLSIPPLLPGSLSESHPPGTRVLCADSSVCWPPIICHYPFPVLAQQERLCPISRGCLPTWGGVEMVLHLLEAHTLDSLELLCKYFFALPLIFLPGSCDFSFLILSSAQVAADTPGPW